MVSLLAYAREAAAISRTSSSRQVFGDAYRYSARHGLPVTAPLGVRERTSDAGLAALWFGGWGVSQRENVKARPGKTGRLKEILPHVRAQLGDHWEL